LKIISLDINNFRNIEKINIKLNKNINIFYGNNGQGKTNILESIWAFTGTKSFRHNKDKELINFNKEFFNISCNYISDRNNNLSIKYSESRKIIEFNKINKNNFSEFSPNFYAVVFSPLDLNIIKDGPDIRRKFIDHTILQIKPSYNSVLKDYKNIINQKNNLLKKFINNEYTLDLLNVYNKQLARIGTFITCTRINFLKEINIYSKKYYNEISNGSENFNIIYNSDIFIENDVEYSEENINIYFEMLEKSVKDDIKYKSSTKGIHKDDFKIYIKDNDAKKYASQGQQRSAVLVIKLAQCDIFKQISGYNPIVLLDDIMSELDSYRTDFVLSYVLDKQVFITTCDNSVFSNLNCNYSIFNISNGNILN